MRRVGFAILASLLFVAAPSLAQTSSVETATKFAKAIQKGDKNAVSRFLAPKIIWAHPKKPDGAETVAGAYGIHLAVLDLKVGRVKSVACVPAEEGWISCDFLRISLFGDGERHLIERYSVENGLIVKIFDEIPPEVVSLFRNG